MGKGRVQLLELQGPGDSVIRLMSEEDLAQVCGKEPNILEELEMIKGLCNYDMNWVKYIFEQHHNYRYWIRLNKLERLP